MSYVNNYRIDMNEISKSMTRFETRFACLSNLKTGDKLGYDEANNLYISSSGYFQSIKRWYYSQTRDSVFKDLNEQIKEYILFLRFLYNSYLGSVGNEISNTQFKKIIVRTHKLSGVLVNALYFLAKTYKDDKKLILKLNKLKEDIDYRNGELKQYII